MDIHNYKRQYERQVELLKESAMSKENKEASLKFRDYLLSEGIGCAKIARYLLDLRKFDRLLGKFFVEANKDDLRRVVAIIEQSELAAESKKAFKIMLRKLYRFLRGIDEKNVYPDEVKWISIALPKNHKKLPEELLTESEIKAMVQNCDNLRDKTLITTLAESGCRISEIGNMCIKHVSFEEHGAKITVKGKTGMRKILIIHSAPYLQRWINEHPKNEDPDAYLWFSQQTDFLSYSRIVCIIKQSAKKAGIKKRIYAHLFRHSRATYLASMMTEAGMKTYFGWGQDSKMCGIYIHMNGEATDSAILKANGIEVKKEVTKLVLQPKKCIKCKKVNESTNRFCTTCGLILDEEYAMEILKNDMERSQADVIMNRLLQDTEIQELIRRKINS